VRAFCGGGGEEGACCQDADCQPVANRRVVCIQEVYDSQNSYCGGAPPPDINGCRADECLADTDCPADRACIPAGAFGYVINVCQTARCRVDADCAARPGGECRGFFDRCYTAGFACTYADDPCRVDADCPPGRFGPQVCVPQANGTVCIEDLPAP
ncbi:MAG: hypothetical protein KC620_12005, partial [Myxococcales bacterium]|nr:hypothetical protein [Myxococcales bacterium]